ncbi:MAG: hypothetical protein FWG68_04710 [Defluviitaleaceae bacterium]|nr:hypothetical protein [Defluviitaleaceae bacterium]
MKKQKIIIALFAAVVLVLSNNTGLIAANTVSQEMIRSATEMSRHLHDENCDHDHGLNLAAGLVYRIHSFYVDDDTAVLSVFPDWTDVNDFWAIPPTAYNGLTAEETAQIQASLNCCFAPILSTRVIRELHTIDRTTGECLFVEIDFMDYCAVCTQPRIVDNSVIRTVTVDVCATVHN